MKWFLLGLVRNSWQTGRERESLLAWKQSAASEGRGRMERRRIETRRRKLIMGPLPVQIMGFYFKSICVHMGLWPTGFLEEKFERRNFSYTSRKSLYSFSKFHFYPYIISPFFFFQILIF